MDAVLTTMVRERVGPGDQAVQLVQTSKDFLGFDYCLALRSPAIALSLALRALNLAEGSSVVISALSPRYYVDAIAELGLRAVYCDVEENSGAATADTIKSALRPGVGAIVLHHCLGIVPDAGAIVELGVPLIEDVSRSYGANWQDKRAGSFGVFTILGLEEQDMLTGGGGALLYAMNRRESSVLRSHGDLAPEYLLPDLNAALASIQFKEAERNFQKRREIAAVYLQAAASTRHRRLVQGGDAEYNNYTFPLVLDTGAKDARIYAAKKEVAAEAAFADCVLERYPQEGNACPTATSLCLRTLRFPLYPRLGKTQVGRIAKVLTTLP
jgi:dTDP-4-amino-4,6-dideoxygalactose transaminase